MTWAECFQRCSIKCSLTSASERPTSEHLYYIAYKHIVFSAIMCHELMVIALTWEGAYGSCQTIPFISSLQLLWKEIELLGRTLKTWNGFCLHSYLCWKFPFKQIPQCSWHNQKQLLVIHIYFPFHDTSARWSFTQMQQCFDMLWQHTKH